MVKNQWPLFLCCPVLAFSIQFLSKHIFKSTKHFYQKQFIKKIHCMQHNRLDQTCSWSECNLKSSFHTTPQHKTKQYNATKHNTTQHNARKRITTYNNTPLQIKIPKKKNRKPHFCCKFQGIENY